MTRVIDGVKIGPMVKKLMGLKLARMVYIHCDRDIGVAEVFVDLPSDQLDDLNEYACRWTVETIRDIKADLGAIGISDEVLAKQVMDAIGTDPTKPCGCCGEWH